MSKFDLSLIVIVLIVIYSGCKNNQKNPNSQRDSVLFSEDSSFNSDSINFLTLDLYEGKHETKQIKELVDTVITIKLETLDECLIGSIDKACISSNHLYILDRDGAKSVFCFSLSGKFVNKYDKRGRGPGEFATLRILQQVVIGFLF